MFRQDLQKLSVTLVLVAATAFVSVAAVSAAGSDTIKLVKPASVSADIGAPSDDWFQRHPDTGIPAEITADTLPSSLDNPNGLWMGPETVSAALGQYAGLATLDDPKNPWIGPETVSAALAQLDDSKGNWIGPETVSAVLGQLQP